MHTKGKDSVAVVYADVIVPLGIEALTFGVCAEYTGIVREGMAVGVQIGARKYYMGIVLRVHDRRPDFRTIKNITGVYGERPLVSPAQLKLWRWVADYYMCPIGDVMRAGLPSALKPEGYSQQEFDDDHYRPPVVQMVGLGENAGDRDALNRAFEGFGRAKAQYRTLLELTGALPEDDLFGAMIPRVRLSADTAILKKLEKKRFMRIVSVEAGHQAVVHAEIPMPQLTAVQTSALEELKRAFETRDVALLHGVTGSGKTEIYINLIHDALREGRDVLYLLPEIALTAQLIERIRAYFGERVVVYHSRSTERKRTEVYRRLAGEEQGGRVVIGVRSAVFLPVRSLGLVIVDEEHESSFKQADPAPRYHARDAAIVLASSAGAKTVLGSATPSIESYTNATTGKYGYVKLSERYGEAVLPKIIISDTLRAAKRGERVSHYSTLLIDKIGGELERGNQVMLFQNRRGFSPYVECPSCGWVAMCPNCNVTLTYHKRENALRCHYCGTRQDVAHNCPACRQGVPETRGFGTEKIEEELQLLFPEARIARLDRDTSTSESRFREIINDFEQRRTDILVGTQMITKGFDFSGVSLVGILNADNLLNYPDFRASERAFQLLTQVAGRAGRRADQGEVVIQTSLPTHPIIRCVVEGDYEGMARMQLAERESFFYPPYCRLIAVSMRYRDRDVLWRAAAWFEQASRQVFGRRVLGPEAPVVDRVKGEFLVGFVIKIERDKSFGRAKELLRKLTEGLKAEDGFRNIIVFSDVDPQ